MTEEQKQEEMKKQFNLLSDLEKEFDEADVEILRITTLKQAPLFEKRNKITDKIAGFWPHVLEDAAGTHGFDEYITPEDADCLTALTSLNVTRPNAEKGDPRDISIAWTFQENSYMPAQTITKLFSHQPGKGMTGLVSTPVEIKWKAGKDLTEGINKAAIGAWEERKARGKGKPEIGEKEQALAKLVDKHTSFFNWFSFSGPHAELGETQDENGEEAPRIIDGQISPIEAFNFGDEIAIQFAEDIYPSAVKYFTSSIEDDDSDEEDSDIDLDLDSDTAKENKKSKRNVEEEDGPAKKKSKK